MITQTMGGVSDTHHFPMNSYHEAIKHISYRLVHAVETNTTSIITRTDHHVQTCTTVVTGVGGGVTRRAAINTIQYWLQLPSLHRTRVELLWNKEHSRWMNGLHYDKACWCYAKTTKCRSACTIVQSAPLLFVAHCLYTVNFLNIWTPKIFVVITLKCEQCCSTIE